MRPKPRSSLPWLWPFPRLRPGRNASVLLGLAAHWFLASALGGQYLVRTWGVDEGLPQSSVMDLAQTPDGYLWIGTLMGGISRFDGVRFVNFDLEGAQRHGPSSVNHLFTDSAGRLWVNYFLGLDRYCQGEFVPELRRTAPQQLRIASILASSERAVLFVTMQGQLLRGTAREDDKWTWEFIPLSNPDRYPNCTADPQGTVWYLRADRTLGRWMNNTFDAVGLGKELAGQRPQQLAADNQGRLWLGTDQALGLWDKDRFESLVPTNGEPSFSVYWLVPGRGDSLWVLTSNRLRRLAGDRWVTEARELGDLQNLGRLVRLAKPDGEGGLWLILQGLGLAHVDERGLVERVTTADGLPSNLLRCVFTDREGNTWTGYDRGGLVRVRRRLFQTISKADGLADAVVSSVCEDREGTIWIGTVGGTLGRWRDGQCTNFTLPKRGQLCQNLVVCPDSAGRLWIGTEGNGVLVYEQGRFQRSTLSIGAASVRMILADRANRIWVGTDDKLYRYDAGEWALAHRQAPETGEGLAAIVETTDGTIWLGTDTGRLLRYSGGQFEIVQPPKEVATSRFWALWPAEEDGLWIGTYATGLLRFRSGSFEQYFLHPGSSWSRVAEGLTDDDGNLWLGTQAGIERVARSPSNDLGADGFQPFQRRVYGRDDGLLTAGTGVEFQPRCWKGRDGRLWFGMANGVASVDPRSVRSNTVPPVAIVEEARMDGRVIPERRWRGNAVPHTSSGAGPASSTGFLRFGPGQHALELRFTAPSLVAAETVRIEYRLAGLEKDWSRAAADRSVRYQALPPGEYRFETRAWNCDGVPGQAEAALAITVVPYFWQTRWFPPAVTGASVLLTGLGVTAFLRARHRKRLAQLEAKQAVERERTRVAQDLHDDLGGSLTRITLLSQAALDKASAAPEVGRIYAVARAMTGAMDEIVWAVNPQNDSLDSLGTYFAEFVEEYLADSGLKFRLEIPLDLPPRVLTSELRHNLFLAFKEALNNVVKHAEAEEVAVKLAVRPHGFILSVEDNGVGFTTSLPLGNTAGRPAERGNGLANMRSRLEKLGGRCAIESQPGQGTRVRFEVNLPA